MTRSERKTTEAYLDDLSRAFNARFTNETHGWGQFLDGPVGNSQVGRYGTSAGAIVLGLTGNEGTQTARHALSTLLGWLHPGAPQAVEHLAQTLPLIMMTLGIGYLEPHSESLGSARELLFSRRLPASKLWGDYWIDAARHAEQPSPFVSALALLALCLTDSRPYPDQRVVDAARELQNYYLRDPDRYRDTDPLIQVAILICLGRKAKSAVINDLRRFSLRTPEITRRYNYFYDYQRPNATWSREYFIIPLELVAILTLWCEAVPAGAKLKARAVAEILMHRLDDGAGGLQLAAGDRHSTLEHGFAALALEAVRNDDESAKRLSLSSVVYEFRRDRPSLAKSGNWSILAAYSLLGLTYALSVFSGVPYLPWSQVALGMSTLLLGVIKEPTRVIREAIGLTR